MIFAGRAVGKVGGWSSVGLAIALVGFVGVGCTPAPVSQSESNTPSESSAPEVASDRPQVVTTTSVLCDLTQQIAEDTVALTCLLAPGQDPHTYQARPSDRQAIDDADLVLYDGYGFVPGLLGLVDASSNPAPQVAVYEAAVPTPLMGAGHDHDHGAGTKDTHTHEDHDHHDHDHGDDAHAETDHESHDHAGDDQHTGEDLVADPHIWHRAVNNAAIAEVIGTHLSDVNPDQADMYAANVATLVEQFTALETWIQAQVETIPAGNRKLVTTHDAFRYYADAYGMEVKGALSGLSNDTQPAAQTMTRLVDQIKSSDVPAIFAESTTNLDLIQTLANNATVEVAADPLLVEGPSGKGMATTTQGMLVTNTCTIVNALGGECQDEQAPI